MHGTVQVKKPAFSRANLITLDKAWRAKARKDFWTYRRYIDENMIPSWYQRSCAAALQKFWTEFKQGKRPKLALMAPPQHGKTRQVREFIGFVAGQDPDLKTIYTSFSDDLGVDANLHLQRLFVSEPYLELFPGTTISHENIVTMSGRYQRNSSMVEFVGRKGSFRNTTVQGQINGKGLDIGIIDDPIKGRAEAQSKLNRDKVWSWLMDDFFSRFSDKGGLIFIMTRWHLDDPMGRFIEAFPDTRVLRFPAYAVQDERYRKEGEPLFPEHKSKEFLEERRKVYTKTSWESLYQQNPIVAGGGIFPVEKFTVARVLDRNKIQATVRYWDKAGTADGGAYTAGVLMHRMEDGRYVIEHVARGQWSALEREDMLKLWAAADAQRCYNYSIVVEQEPGSGGKESAESSIRSLAGYNVSSDKVTGSKEVRADPYAAQVQGGNVELVAGEWIADFIDEHESFPTGKYKDQVDASAGAFAKLAAAASYDYSYKGWS